MESEASGEDERHAWLESIFRLHVDDLYRYIYRQVRQSGVAEDLTSAVFLKALRWLERDRGPQSVKGWLYATARSLIADYWREEAQFHFLPLEEAEETPLPSAESAEQRQALHERIQRLLAGLSPRERDILSLRYFQGFTAVEIGRMLGLSAEHVRVLQLRALRRAAALESREGRVPMEQSAIPYTEQAQRALEFAKEESQALQQGFIGTEHLLLGLLREGSATTELVNHGVTLERVRGGVRFIAERTPPQVELPSQPGFTPRAQQVLSLAGEEARRAAEAAISPQHILIAILREGQGIGAQLLLLSDVRLEQVGDRAHVKIEKVEPEPGPVTLPADFQQALEQQQEARAFFEKLSSARQRQFVDSIEQAGGEPARSQHVQRMVEWLRQLSRMQRQQQ